MAVAETGQAWLQPLYLQVARQLESELVRQSLRPGNRLPGERVLSERFHVSRVTTRRALTELSARGLIRPAPGRGWFVAEAVLGEPNALMSLSAMAADRGLEVTSDVLLARSRPATIDEADQLAIAPGELIFELERVRFLNRVGVSVDHSRVPLRAAPDLPATDFSVASLYHTLEEAGAVPTRADYRLQAEPADRRRAELLGLNQVEPLLVAVATVFDQDGNPLELSRAAYRGDRYRFSSTLYRHPSAAGR